MSIIIFGTGVEIRTLTNYLINLKRHAVILSPTL